MARMVDVPILLAPVTTMRVRLETAPPERYIPSEEAPRERARPRTVAEAQLVAATLGIFREMRAAGMSGEEAWHRVTDLCDGTMVRPVMYGEAYRQNLDKQEEE